MRSSVVVFVRNDVVPHIALCERHQRSEKFWSSPQVGAAFDLAGNVADDATEIGSELLQGPVGDAYLADRTDASLGTGSADAIEEYRGDDDAAQ